MGLAQLPLQPPVPLTSTHLVTDFDCGVDSLNEWLCKRAWKNQTIGTSRTFVVSDGEIVIGYYCLSSAAIDRVELPKAKQRNMPDPIPAVLIGRLAVDVRYQGRKIGVSLLQDALCRIIGASQSIGIAYILVHALDDSAKLFYETKGFVAIPEQPLTLFLPVATAALAMQS
ncbi:GNAT family N-acetyltransferase [Chamaesiphon sp. OTE_75_metabat_556]|uniref:GNAT family N-acetyltransferase n=1 Tax=Chamaesiphon sp. OTE_75_metabat_556 TaxID=2964692 RepID=UPI00286B574C|nr:GNAT family N-acetyltransferase [Chamaesiphon sp. OTE_75_metabat_556]